MYPQQYDKYSNYNYSTSDCVGREIKRREKMIIKTKSEEYVNLDNVIVFEKIYPMFSTKPYIWRLHLPVPFLSFYTTIKITDKYSIQVIDDYLKN